MGTGHPPPPSTDEVRHRTGHTATAHMTSSSTASNVNDLTAVKRTAAALGPADPAPPVKRRRWATSPLPSSVKAASSRRATSPSPSAGKTAAAALGPADPAPPVKRRRWATSPLPSPLKAASSRRATSPSPSAGKTAPRVWAAKGTRTPTRATSSSVKAAWLARSPTRFAGKSASRLARGIRTPGQTSSSVKAASPAVRGSHSKNLEATSKRLRDGRISSDALVDIRLSAEIDRDATEIRDASATVAASHLEKASICDSVLRNKSKFSGIYSSAKVSDPLPTIDLFLGVYEDTVQWKNIAESVASAGQSYQYWVDGDHSVHELCLPKAVGSPSTMSTMKNPAEIAKKCCRLMRGWFLGFMDDALDVDYKWIHNSNTQTLVSQFKKIGDWLEHQITEEEWTMKMIKRLKPKIGHCLRRLEDGIVPPRTRSRWSRVNKPVHASCRQ